MDDIYYSQNPGTSSLRGKQHGIRIDADIKRTTKSIRDAQVSAATEQAVAARTAQDNLESVAPSALVGALAVCDRSGTWHEVVRVNKTTVSVKTGHSWVDKIPHAKIVAVRRSTV